MLINLYIGFEQNDPEIVYEKCYYSFSLRETKIIDLLKQWNYLLDDMTTKDALVIGKRTPKRITKLITLKGSTLKNHKDDLYTYVADLIIKKYGEENKNGN